MARDTTPTIHECITCIVARLYGAATILLIYLIERKWVVTLCDDRTYFIGSVYFPALKLEARDFINFNKKIPTPYEKKVEETCSKMWREVLDKVNLNEPMKIVSLVAKMAVDMQSEEFDQGATIARDCFGIWSYDSEEEATQKEKLGLVKPTSNDK